jgi:hypothetical protein
MNSRRHFAVRVGIALTIPLTFSFAAHAATSPDARKPVYGNVTVCYYTPNCTFPIVASGLVNPLSQPQRDGDHPTAITPASSAVVDGPAFQITNTGTAPMTSVKLKILANASLGVKEDIFTIGTISPGNSFVVIPGLSNDGKKRKSSLFFYYSGSALDTSDSGPNANAITFEVNGIVNGKGVTTGDMEAGTTVGPSNDKTVSAINFLGGPGNADGPCNDCVGPIVIGTISR